MSASITATDPQPPSNPGTPTDSPRGTVLYGQPPELDEQVEDDWNTIQENTDTLDVEKKGYKGQTVLMRAVVANQYQFLIYYFAMKGRPDSMSTLKDDVGRTLTDYFLDLCDQKKNVWLIESVLDTGVLCIEDQDSKGRTILMRALAAKQWELFKNCFKSKGSHSSVFTLKDNERRTLTDYLFDLCEQEEGAEIVGWMLVQDCPSLGPLPLVEVQDEQRRTILMRLLAAKKCKVVCDYFESKGPPSSMSTLRDCRQRALPHYLATFGNVDLWNQVKRDDAFNPTVLDVDGYTALHNAVQREDLDFELFEAICESLKQRADTTSTDASKVTPLHLVCRNKGCTVKWVEHLLSFNARPERKDGRERKF